MNDQHIDLDREAVYNSAGRRITEDYVAEAGDAIERDDVTEPFPLEVSLRG